MADILVVDDEQAIAAAFEHFFAYEGHSYRIASNAVDAVRLINERRPNLVMMDIRMPGIDGLQALHDMRERFPGLFVVMMTGYGTSQTSIDAIRAGAFDYLTKPLDLDQLREVIAKALAAQKVAAPDAVSDEELQALPPRPTLVGETPAMLEVYKTIGRLATTDVPALVLGERGTGKQLVVATIHDNSPRRERSFVSVNCRGGDERYLDAQIFAPGIGTVHVAAVDALPLPVQIRLAQALEERREHRNATPALEARIIASSEANLHEAVGTGQFSRELYDALAVVSVQLPPLRDRRDDIPLLVRYFIHRFNVELNRAVKSADETAGRMLLEYTWPGNVGELERVIKRACILARSDVITLEDIGGRLTDARGPSSEDVEASLSRMVRMALQERLVNNGGGAAATVYHDILDVVESTLVKEALAITSGNQVKAAQLLGVNRATLRKKIQPDD